MRRTEWATAAWRTCAAGLLLGVALFTAGPASAQTVSNGDFETPVLTADIQRFDAGNTFGGWTVDSGNVEILQSIDWLPHGGNQSLDLSGVTAGSISQAVTTVPGHKYLLSFWVAGNPSGTPTVKSMQVSFGSTTLPTQTFDTTGHDSYDMGWSHRQYNVTATASSTLLRFTSLDDSDAGMALDDISITDADQTAPSLSAGTVGQVGASNSLPYVPITITDTGSGVATVTLTAASTNCHLEYPLGTPVVAPGTPRPHTVTLSDPTRSITVYAVKDSNASSHVTVQAWDAVNNTATLDPVVATLSVKGGAVSRSFSGISQSEHFLSLQNGTPGLGQTNLWVNGKLAFSGSLQAGQTVDLDLAPWLRHGKNNSVRVVALGRAGASATLTIGESAAEGPAGASGSAGHVSLDFGP